MERMVWGGDGLARDRGKVVFVPLTAPGDVALVEVLSEHRSFSRARLLRLLRGSPERTDPACPLFGDCGGCQWQHLSYGGQLRSKGEILVEALRRPAGLRAPEAVTVSPSPLQYGYRHRARLHCRRSSGTVEMGFFHARSHDVVPLRHCPVLHPSLNEVLSFLPAVLSGAPSPFRDLEALTLAADFHGTRVRLNLLGRHGQLVPSRGIAEALEREAGARGVALGLPGSSFAPLDIGPGPAGPRAAGDAFTQVNLLLNQALVKEVTALLGPAPGEEILDLYCGIGNFSLPAAAAGASVLGVEVSGEAVRSARDNAARAAGVRCRFRRGRADEASSALARRGRTFDAVLLNPPRTGCRETLRHLPALSPSRIVMVSCDPSTFARDGAALASEGYGLTALRAFDLFPQTSHFETVGLFRR